MPLDLRYRSYHLQFLHPFGVSSNTRTETQTFFVKLTSGEVSGYGEACLPAYLGGNEGLITDGLDKCAEILASVSEKEELNSILEKIAGALTGNNVTLAAIDIALHDLFAKLKGVPVFSMQGYPQPTPRATSFTIAIDSADKLKQKIIEADDYSILKIKAGTRDDKKLIREIRRHTYKPLYVDVNQGWKDKHMVLDMLGWMKEQNTLLVEQPMPVNMYDEMAWVTEKSPLPTIADESAKVLSDLDKIKGVFSGINLKLMKCGGLKPGFEMIKKAHSMGMKVMLGCMAESSCGISAMGQLLAFADYVDLDAPLLYRNDPFTGLTYGKGKIQLGQGGGTGVKPAQGLLL